jgi:hypothetical protein
MANHWFDSSRRSSPRVTVESFCTELHDQRMEHGIVTDLSSEGLCIHRPFGGRHGPTIPIEFEIPEVDEVMWALGQVCFDEVKHAPKNSPVGMAGMVRSTGIRLLNAAERHRRLLREYVMDTWRATEAPVSDYWLTSASCYRRG